MSGTIHLIKKKNLTERTNTSFYNSPDLPKKHNHVEIQFKDFRLIYNDPRRFGFFKFIENKKELKKRFSHLGPEPFFKNFNLEYLKTIQDKNIKVILAGMIAPTSYGFEYKSNFDQIYPDLSKQYNLPLIPFLLEDVALKPELNLSDGMHPNKKVQLLLAKLYRK